MPNQFLNGDVIASTIPGVLERDTVLAPLIFRMAGADYAGWGHSQQTHFLHYAHVIDAVFGERHADLDALVAAARNSPAVPRTFPAAR